MPNLVEGKTTGSSETVAEARAEWSTAGFDAANFFPNNGQNNKTVTGQGDGLGNSLTPGVCYPVTQRVFVTYS
jgi:hypothetical protein